jgi:hypothetical protein
MDAIQRLRSRAQANGKLQSTSQQKVTTQTEQQKQYVVIEPAAPNAISVPYYQPAVVYGAWPYPAYPPYYWPPPPGYVAASAYATGVAFAAGVAVGYAAWGNCDWDRHSINVVNRNVNINNITRNDFSPWAHDPDHRHGVRYNNDAVRQRYARTDPQAAAGRDQRLDFRGRDGQPVLDPAGSRPDAGDRGNLGDRGRPDAGAARPGRESPPDLGARDSGARDLGARDSGARGRSSAAGGGAFSNIDAGAQARGHSERGRQSVGGGGGGGRSAGGERGGGRGRR